MVVGVRGRLERGSEEFYRLWARATGRGDEVPRRVRVGGRSMRMSSLSACLSPSVSKCNVMGAMRASTKSRRRVSPFAVPES